MRKQGLKSSVMAEKVGRRLIRLLDLEEKGQKGRVDTAWGDVSPDQLARFVDHLIRESLSDSPSQNVLSLDD